MKREKLKQFLTELLKAGYADDEVVFCVKGYVAHTEELSGEYGFYTLDAVIDSEMELLDITRSGDVVKVVFGIGE